MKTSLLSVALLVFLLSGCEDKPNEDKTKDIDKTGAIETRIAVSHLPDGQHDLLTTSHVIWKDRDQVKTSVSYDTIPTLGLITTQGEDAAGYTQTVTVPRDYEVYITVK